MRCHAYSVCSLSSLACVCGLRGKRSSYMWLLIYVWAIKECWGFVGELIDLTLSPLWVQRVTYSHMKVTPVVRQEQNKETITACNGQEKARLLSVRGGRGGAPVRQGKYRLVDQERHGIVNLDTRQSAGESWRSFLCWQQVSMCTWKAALTTEQHISLASFSSFATRGIVFPQLLMYLCFHSSLVRHIFFFSQEGDCFCRSGWSTKSIIPNLKAQQAQTLLSHYMRALFAHVFEQEPESW